MLWIIVLILAILGIVYLVNKSRETFKIVSSSMSKAELIKQHNLEKIKRAKRKEAYKRHLATRKK